MVHATLFPSYFFRDLFALFIDVEATSKRSQYLMNKKERISQQHINNPLSIVNLP